MIYTDCLLDSLLSHLDGIDWIVFVGPLRHSHRTAIQALVERESGLPVLVIETSPQRIDCWESFLRCTPHSSKTRVFPISLGLCDGLQTYYDFNDLRTDGTLPPDQLANHFPDIVLRQQQLVEALSLATILRSWQPASASRGEGLLVFPSYSWKYTVGVLSQFSRYIHKILVVDQYLFDEEFCSCLVSNGFMLVQATQPTTVWITSDLAQTRRANNYDSCLDTSESWDTYASMFAWTLPPHGLQSDWKTPDESIQPCSSSKELHLPIKGLNLLFDGQYYLDTYADVAEAGSDPLWHFVHFGWAEGRRCRDAHPSSYQSSDKELGWLNDFVFVEYYLDQLPPALALEIDRSDIVKHYLTVGQLAGLNPNPFFDFRYYLLRNHDVLAAGQDLILHYLRFGHREGRQIHPLIPTSLFIDDEEQDVPGISSLLSRFLDGMPVQTLDGFWLPWPRDGTTYMRQQQLVQWMQLLESEITGPLSEPLLHLLQIFDCVKPSLSLSTPSSTWARLIDHAARRSISGYCFLFSINSLLPSDALLQTWADDSKISTPICLILDAKTFRQIPPGFSGWIKLVFQLSRFLGDSRYFLLRQRPVLLLDIPPDLPDSLDCVRRLRLALACVGVVDACLVQVWHEQSSVYLHYGVDAAAPTLASIDFSDTHSDVFNHCGLARLSPWISPTGLSWTQLIVNEPEPNPPNVPPLPVVPLNSTSISIPPVLAGRTELLLIGHDAFNAGAQRALLCLINDIMDRNQGLHLSLLLYGPGQLLQSYQELCPTHVLLPEDGATLIEKFTQRLLMPGYDGGICFNSLASLPHYYNILASICRPSRSILIIHELPCQIERRPDLVELTLKTLPLFSIVITPCHMAEKLWRQWLLQQDHYQSASHLQDWLVMPPLDSAALVLDLDLNYATVSWPSYTQHRIVGFGYDNVSFQRFRNACQRLRHQLPNTIGLWVGSGGGSEEGILCYESVCVSLILQQADLFLLCKSYEPFGLIAAEALRLGCPVLAYHSPTIGVADWWPNDYRFELTFGDLDLCVARMHEICVSGKSDRGLRQQVAAASVNAIQEQRTEALRCLQQMLPSHKRSARSEY